MLKEPEANYPVPSSQGKQIMFFNSFEEAEEYRYRQLALLSPEEHLSNAVRWIKRLYADDLKKNPRLGKNLRID